MVVGFTYQTDRQNPVLFVLTQPLHRTIPNDLKKFAESYIFKLFGNLERLTPFLLSTWMRTYHSARFLHKGCEKSVEMILVSTWRSIRKQEGVNPQ